MTSKKNVYKRQKRQFLFLFISEIINTSILEDRFRLKKIIQGQATETRKRKVSIIDVNDFDDTQTKTSKSQKREHCEVCGQILNEQNIWFVCKVCGNYCC